MEESITVTATDIEGVLRAFMSDLDYDLHKGIECDEETGEDGYPEMARIMFRDLQKAANGRL